MNRSTMTEAQKRKHAAYQKKYRENHQDKIKAYREKHRDEIKAQRKIYYEDHKELILAQRRVYYEEHKEECKAYRKAYYAAHREEINAKRRQKKPGESWRAMIQWTSEELSEICQADVEIETNFETSSNDWAISRSLDVVANDEKLDKKTASKRQRLRAYQREWTRKNPERRKEIRHKSYMKNRDKQLAAANARYHRKKEQRERQKREAEP